jgi:methylmalonyl-CoA/ethylmalonyl-CoA epimerase
MTAGGLKLPPLFHVGIVVADMESAEQRFGRAHGVTAERRMDVEVKDAQFRGRRADFSATYVFLPLGNTELELIQPLEGDSPYSEFLSEHGEGVHHLAFVVESIDDQLARLRTEAPDCSVTLDASVPVPRVRFVYVEGTSNGATLEFVEMGASDDS